TLDAQADAFDKLRRLDRTAPEVLESLTKDQATLDGRIDAATQTLKRLAAEYPEADLSTVAGVPAQARKLSGFAATAVDKARDELAKPKGEAAVAVRAAQQAVGQVTQLLASVDTLAADLAAQAELHTKAAAELEQQLQRSGSVVSAAQDYITTHRGAVGPAARTRISEASRHLEAALSSAASDPGRGLVEAQEADRLAVAAIQAARADVAEYERSSGLQEQGDAAVPEYQQADSAGLGGILSDLFFGSGSGSGSPSRPSNGGWSWGTGSGGGSGGWTSSKPSGFGGSSRRASSSFRRSSGSSSRSSGGRRGGGGRF
ncbi:MAG TPA: hypothetical protein VF479_06380, partial [Pseudolysinimonas sp.]